MDGPGGSSRPRRGPGERRGEAASAVERLADAQPVDVLDGAEDLWLFRTLYWALTDTTTESIPSALAAANWVYPSVLPVCP